MDLPSLSVITLMALVLGIVSMMGSKNKATNLSQRTKLMWSFAGFSIILVIAVVTWWIADSQISK